MYYVCGSRNSEIYTAILKHPGITREEVSGLWCNEGHGHTSMWVRTDINRMISAGIVKGTKTGWSSEKLEIARKVDIRTYPLYDKDGNRVVRHDATMHDEERRVRRRNYIKENPQLNIWLDGIGVCFDGPDADHAEVMFILGEN
ncbi:hypothetical protein [Sphingomonas sp. CFBP 8760]|uniref:hypothetical protein n=1 Tax=Sphingomonas sp. CFBP 8760 TaxID=2775282 RepID=UPI001A92A7D5|nr:hypothetical protein [Sphingomonas sp. CFBP 8760]